MILSASLKIILGVDEDSLIETWDEGHNVGDGWVNHQIDTNLDVSKIDALLYRTQGVEDGKGMEDEIEKIRTRAKSRKRPMEYNSASERVVQARTSTTPVKHNTSTAVDAIKKGPAASPVSSFSDLTSPDIDPLVTTLPKTSQLNATKNAGGKNTNELDIDPDSDNRTFEDDD